MSAVLQPATLTSIDQLTGAQRAAILVMYLQPEVARRMLDKLDDDELRNLGRVMAEIGPVEPDVVEGVVAAFVRDLHKISILPQTGREYALRVLPGLLDERRRARVVGPLRREISSDFAELVSNRPAGTVAAVLRDEHPQTRAVALVAMGSENAARVLAELDEDARYDASVRMARLSDVPGELVDEVETSLTAALQDRGTARWEAKGVERAAKALGRLGKATHDVVLGRIADEDRTLSDDLRRRMVSFSDLGTLDNRSVQALLKGIERNALITALRGASPELRELFLANMSQRAAEDIREEMELLGPIPRAQVQQSQEDIVQIALKLAEEGTVRLSTGGEDMV